MKEKLILSAIAASIVFLVWRHYTKPEIVTTQWAGTPTVMKGNEFVPLQGAVIGLRSDGVVVWKTNQGK